MIYILYMKYPPGKSVSEAVLVHSFLTRSFLTHRALKQGVGLAREGFSTCRVVSFPLFTSSIIERLTRQEIWSFLPSIILNQSLAAIYSREKTKHSKVQVEFNVFHTASLSLLKKICINRHNQPDDARLPVWGKKWIEIKSLRYRSNFILKKKYSSMVYNILKIDVKGNMKINTFL